VTTRAISVGGLIHLIAVIAGAAAGLVGLAPVNWSWVRHRRSIPVRKHRDPDGDGGALFDAPLDSPGGAADPAREDPNPVPARQQAKRRERSSSDEFLDLLRSASAEASRAGNAVVPTVTAEIEMEPDKDRRGMHSDTVLATALSTELVSFSSDVSGNGAHSPTHEVPWPALWPADETDTELSVEPGAACTEDSARSVAGPLDLAPCEMDCEAATASPSDKAQLQEFTHPDQVPGGKDAGEAGRASDDTAEAAGGAECHAGENASLVAEGAVALPDAVAEDAAREAANAGEAGRASPLPSKPARHRDRRGARRMLSPQPASQRPASVVAAIRAPAEARLRLMLHPIRRAATLSAVLARPVGYPDHVNLLLDDGAAVSAYSEDRYDDIDLDWTPDLLSGEIRLDCKEGYQWLRSARRIHIFGEVADEPGVVSVGSAALSSPSTIVCRVEDAMAVRAAAEACGSPPLLSHDYWSGIPNGWTILAGYWPIQSATSELTSGMTGLDPGVGSEIRFSAGLRIRSASFAEGSPPRIEISPLPAGAVVTIDGQPSELGEDGAWRADGWDRPGDHLIDVLPGPSAAYRVLEDPWSKGGWEAWDAHPERFGALQHAPWAVAQVCGSTVSGPSGEYVVAAEATRSVVCLGLRCGSVVLQGRPDAPVAVGLLREPPAFLISASGPRRNQGRIEWLSPSAPGPSIRTIDPQWIVEVRAAASKRLPLDRAGPSARDAWQRARERARRHRRPRS
jgi:hypothetical protein